MESRIINTAEVGKEIINALVKLADIVPSRAPDFSKEHVVKAWLNAINGWTNVDFYASLSEVCENFTNYPTIADFKRLLEETHSKENKNRLSLIEAEIAKANAGVEEEPFIPTVAEHSAARDWWEKEVAAAPKRPKSAPECIVILWECPPEKVADLRFIEAELEKERLWYKQMGFPPTHIARKTGVKDGKPTFSALFVLYLHEGQTAESALHLFRGRNIVFHGDAKR